jgi:peptide/nickel transport system ATP-binding protein
LILQISSGILAEAGLSILGLGPKTTEVPTLGLMMNWAMIYSAHIMGKWWAYFPVIVNHRSDFVLDEFDEYRSRPGIQSGTERLGDDMSKVMLEVRELTTKYITRFREDVYAVDHVSLKVEEGKSLGIAGESGCGKSTLALSLMGYYFPPLHYTSGEIIIDGKNISGMKPDDIRKSILGTEIAYIPQSAMNALNPTQKIIHFVEDVIQAHNPIATKKDIYELARYSFENLGLPAEVLQKYPVELSGGMKQRTVIAISTILFPKVLIADEPSSALDVTSQKMVIKMLRDLMEKGIIKSMIFITHELPLLYNVTDDIMVMYAGQIVEKATAKKPCLIPSIPIPKA